MISLVALLLSAVAAFREPGRHLARRRHLADAIAQGESLRLSSPRRRGSPRFVLAPALVAAIGYTLSRSAGAMSPRLRSRGRGAVVAWSWRSSSDATRPITPRIVYQQLRAGCSRPPPAALAAITAAVRGDLAPAAVRRRAGGVAPAHRVDRGRPRELIAGYEITSWLRGPRAITSDFACESRRRAGRFGPGRARRLIGAPAARDDAAPAPASASGPCAAAMWSQSAATSSTRPPAVPRLGAPIPGERGVVKNRADARQRGGQLALARATVHRVT